MVFINNKQIFKVHLCTLGSGFRYLFHAYGMPLLVLLSTLMLSSGCSDISYRGYVTQDVAAESNFNRKLVSGELFEHVVYESHLDNIEKGTLKVYIEGDGLPWYRGRSPSGDPTPGEPLALRLMAQDLTAAIYIGRPCYFGLNHSSNCTSTIWTFARYSEEVIASMNRVVKQYQEILGITKVVLIGYSGGGVIATLMAKDINLPTFLLTISANLDIDAWTTSRGFLPLDESLNPVDFIEQLQDIRQLHLIAVEDKTVPPFVTRLYTDKLPRLSSRQYPNFDHKCCWVSLWRQILRESPWSKPVGNNVESSL